MGVGGTYNVYQLGGPGEPNNGAGTPGEYWTHMYGLHDYRPGNLAGYWNDFPNLSSVGNADPVNGVAEVVPSGADYLPEQSLRV